MTKRLSNYDIVLRVLAEHNGTSRELMQYISGMSLATIQGTVHRLVADGKVAKCAGPRGVNGESKWCLKTLPDSDADKFSFWISQNPAMRMCDRAKWARVAGSFDELVEA